MLSFISANLKNTDKHYKSIRSTSPTEIINDKKLKGKQIDTVRTISKPKLRYMVHGEQIVGFVMFKKKGKFVK